MGSTVRNKQQLWRFINRFNETFKEFVFGSNIKVNETESEAAESQ